MEKVIRKIGLPNILLVVLFLLLFMFGRHPIVGSSMYPTYTDGQHAFSVKSFCTLHQGDVVVAFSPTKKLFIKRVAAVPGDTIVIEQTGNVLVNGEQYPYGHGDANHTPNFDGMESLEDGTHSVSLGKGEYFLMGDNFENSSDSRMYGVFKRWRLIEKVMVVH